MTKIWQKDYSLNKQVEVYCFGQNAKLDNKLVPYDVLGSIAHAKMLSSIGVLTKKEFIQLKKQLLQIIQLSEAGKFVIEAEDEDVHSKVEDYLIKTSGSVGKKLHTGRSRNDQVLVDLKLYTKANLLDVAFAGLELGDAFVDYAKKYESVPMPGYTHMQKAMPSSVGMWAGSFAQSLVDDLMLLKSSFDHNDQNPLGSGAAYGVPLSINRAMTTELLGFAKIQNNSLYAQSSRAKSHLSVLQALVQLMLTLSRFASDVLLFTTAEFDFFSFDKALSSGSSIMPQKHNLDVMEILRAKTSEIVSHQQLIASMGTGLISGYNADFAQTKEPLMKSLETALSSLEICLTILDSLKPNVKNMQASCSSEIYATHSVYQLVEKGVPFRDAYKQVASSLSNKNDCDKQQILKTAAHEGATGNLASDKIRQELKIIEAWWAAKNDAHQQAISNLKGEKNHAN